MPTVSETQSRTVVRSGAAGAQSSLPRLLYVATSSGDGGIERHSVGLAAALRARGAALQYACRSGSFVEAQCQLSGVPSHPWAVRNSGDIAAARTLARFLRARQIEIVHVHSRRDYVPALLAVAWARQGAYCPKLVLHVHLVRRLGDPARLGGWFFQHGADAVIAVSNAVRERLMGEHRFPEAFVPLIYNGVPLESYALPGAPQASAWRAERRRQWNIPADALVIGMVGRLNAKGQEMLLSVAPQIAARFPAVYFVLVGPDGKYGDRQRLEVLAQVNGAADRVIIPGATDDIPATMAAFDLLAHLPADESFGLALVEAMAAGLPTVATMIGGCMEVVQNKETGLLVPLGDLDALISALSALLTDKTLRARLGQAGRQAAEETFSQQRQLESLERLYRALCPHSRQ